MALNFQNQGIATAKIGLAGFAEEKTFTMAGVNGELTDASKFTLAVEKLLDVVGWQPIYSATSGYGTNMRRITTQRVAGLKE